MAAASTSHLSCTYLDKDRCYATLETPDGLKWSIDWHSLSFVTLQLTDSDPTRPFQHMICDIAPNVLSTTHLVESGVIKIKNDDGDTQSLDWKLSATGEVELESDDPISPAAEATVIAFLNSQRAQLNQVANFGTHLLNTAIRENPCTAMGIAGQRLAGLAAESINSACDFTYRTACSILNITATTGHTTPASSSGIEAPEDDAGEDPAAP